MKYDIDIDIDIMANSDKIENIKNKLQILIDTSTNNELAVYETLMDIENKIDEAQYKIDTWNDYDNNNEQMNRIKYYENSDKFIETFMPFMLLYHLFVTIRE